MLMGVYESARADTTEYHRMGVKQQKLISSSIRG